MVLPARAPVDRRLSSARVHSSTDHGLLPRGQLLSKKRRKTNRVKTSGYFLFAFAAGPLCGLVAVVCFSFAAADFVGNDLVVWDLVVLLGVPIALVVLAGDRARMTSQQIVAASIGVAGLTLAVAFVLLLLAVSQANFVTPML
jgi:hypothetical protein